MATSNKSGRILIVDDNEDLLAAARIFLKRHFAEIDVEKNPESIPDLITKLAQVFPKLADLDITDKSVTYNRVSEAMRKLYILRQSLVWKPDKSEK